MKKYIQPGPRCNGQLFIKKNYLSDDHDDKTISGRSNFIKWTS